MTSPVDELFRENASDELYARYEAFMRYDQKIVTSTLATCKGALQVFADPNVAKATAFDTIDFAAFRAKKTALFINNSIADQKFYSALTNVFAEQFFAQVLSRIPEKGEQDIFFLLDECSSLKLPTLPLVAANIRKHRGALMIVVQDYRQLVTTYGKDNAEAIRANCVTKLYFTGQSYDTTRELENILGKTEYEDEDKRKHVRALMTADELRTMPRDRAILLSGNRKPIKVYLRPYYENYKYKKYAALPPLTFAGQLPFFAVPTYQLPEPQPIDE